MHSLDVDGRILNRNDLDNLLLRYGFKVVREEEGRNWLQLTLESTQSPVAFLDIESRFLQLQSTVKKLKPFGYSIEMQYKIQGNGPYR